MNTTVRVDLNMMEKVFCALHPEWRAARKAGKKLPGRGRFCPGYFEERGYRYVIRKARTPRYWSRLIKRLPWPILRDFHAQGWDDRKITIALTRVFARYSADRRHGALADPPGNWGPNYVAIHGGKLGYNAFEAIERTGTDIDKRIARMEGPIKDLWKCIYHRWDPVVARRRLVDLCKQWEKEEARVHFSSFYLRQHDVGFIRSIERNWPGGVQPFVQTIPYVRKYWFARPGGPTDDEIRAAVKMGHRSWTRDRLNGRRVWTPFGVKWMRGQRLAKYAVALKRRGVETVLAGDEWKEVRAAWGQPVPGALMRMPHLSLAERRTRADALEARQKRVVSERRACAGLTVAQMQFGIVLAHVSWKRRGNGLPFDRAFLVTAGLGPLHAAAVAAPRRFDKLATNIAAVRFDWVDRNGVKRTRPRPAVPPRPKQPQALPLAHALLDTAGLDELPEDAVGELTG